MTHLKVYELFLKIFPHYENYIITWYQHGRNSVRIKLMDNQMLIFTIDDRKDWSLETVGNFIKRIERR